MVLYQNKESEFARRTFACGGPKGPSKSKMGALAGGMNLFRRAAGIDVLCMDGWMQLHPTSFKHSCTA